MIDVVEMIPSRDMREALRKSNRQFTDLETATLIHNLNLPRKRRRELLQQIADETQDENLRDQIVYKLALEHREEEWFCKVSDGCVFGVLELDEEDLMEAMNAYFPNFDLAFEYGLTLNCVFEIHKWRVLQKIPIGNQWFPGDCGYIRFNAEGSIDFTCLWETGQNESLTENIKMAPWLVGSEEKNWPNYLFFEDRWVDLPNLYDAGDLVCIVGIENGGADSAYDWAVVDTSQKLWQTYREQVNAWLEEVETGCLDEDNVMADYSDMQVTVEIPCKDGTFSHDHINPMFLELAIDLEPKDDDETELREVAQNAASRGVSLDWLSNVLAKNILSHKANNS